MDYIMIDNDKWDDAGKKYKLISAAESNRVGRRKGLDCYTPAQGIFLTIFTVG